MYTGVLVQLDMVYNRTSNYLKSLKIDPLC